MQYRRKAGICERIVKLSVGTEEYYLCGIYEFISQIICKNDTVQVFATACGIILTGFLAEIVYNYLILVIK